MGKDDNYLKSHGFINSAFAGIKSLTDIHKAVIESPMDYKNYGNWNLCCYDCEGNAHPAVQVTSGYKSYQTKNGPRPILFNMNMTVKKNTIYSLLGSSGCGKTTLLSCIVGLKHLDSGEVLISGRKRGTASCPVPGKGVGFMPQDIALYSDFSIAETINYFGRLYGMKDEELDKSRNFLIELLSLPEQSRRVAQLSGGQQRRVSMAVTLVAGPPLLILDEPTVGVDPLLRETIWKHITGLVEAKKTTVIVTTHYIEEAAHSHNVGVMRGGRLLTEKSPEDLYTEFGINNLQDVVLRLCQNDEGPTNGVGRQERSKSSGNIMAIAVDNMDQTVFNKQKCQKEETFCWDPENIKRSFARIRSLCRKNFSVMMRNIILLAFVILMPALQIILMGMSMGNDPKPMRLGVVTNETCDYDNIYDLKFPPGEGDCILANLSCRFLANLDREIVELIPYETDEEAKAQVVSGSIRGYMRFPENYSDYMFERSSGGTNLENSTIEGSTISLEIDASNTVITKSLQRIMYEAYFEFVKGLLGDCGMNPEVGNIPIKMEEPVYGDFDMKLQQFVAAGMLVGVALFFPLASSTITFIWDKKQGTIERAIVAGTKIWEILASYFITEGTILMIQTTFCLFIFTTVFSVKIVGSIPLAFSLVALNGFAGISLGLLLSSICKEEIEAILLAMAIMMPNFFLAGAMWPRESQAWLLSKLSILLPGTLSNEAFRSIVIRGWGISHYAVWSGFASTLAWISFYWILSIYVHKYRSAKQ